MEKPCDRCGELVDEDLLCHPVNEDGDEINPEEEYCESCAMEVESEEDERRHPNPFKGLSEEEMIKKIRESMFGK